MKNKKRKLLVILSVMVLLICSIGIILYTRVNSNTKDKKTNTNVVKKEEKKKEESDKVDVQDEKTNETKEENKTSTSEVESKDSNNDKNTSKETKKENSNSTILNNDSTSNNNSTTPSSSTSSSNNTDTTTTQETPKQPTAWEQLGISEYDYYNSPMLKWQKVTHSDFDSCNASGKEATKVKINPETGESYQDYTSYWCYGVNSYSGRSLGVMLDLE